MKTWLSWMFSLAILLVMISCGEDETEADLASDVLVDSAPAAPPAPGPPAASDTTPIPVTVIVAGPAGYLGRSVVGTARVAEVVSDRGFWLEQDGERIFAVIAQTPQMENAVNVNQGQTVVVAGVVYDSATADQVPGELEPDAKQIIADQPAFLYVAAQNVILLGPDTN